MKDGKNASVLNDGCRREKNVIYNYKIIYL